MNKRKSSFLIWAVLIGGVVLFWGLLIYAVIGPFEGGSPTRAAEFPHFSQYFEGLSFEGDIKYIYGCLYYKSCHGWKNNGSDLGR